MYYNISIDVDTYATDYLTSKCDTEKMVIASYETGLSKLIKYFEQNNIKVTLFVVANHVKIPFVRDYLKYLILNGHEVASHSLSHYRNFIQLEPGKIEEEITKSKEILEDALGVRVEGFRAPGYTITPKIWELLIKGGYTYDASLNNSPFYYVFKTFYKFFSKKGQFFVIQKLRGFPLSSTPFEVSRVYFRQGKSREFWEVPSSYSKTIFFPLLIFMLNQLPNWICQNIVRSAIKSSEDLIQIQFHDYDFTELKDLGPFKDNIYFIKKYIKKTVEKRQKFYDYITLNLLNNREPILLKDYVNNRLKSANQRL